MTALQPRGAGRGHRGRVAVGITAAAVLAVLAVTIGVRPGGGHRPATAHRATASQPAAPAAASPAAPAATVLPSRFPGLRWQDFYGVQLPVSRAAGPRHERNGLAWGFADTPAGALLAAVNIGVRANAQWGPAIFGPTIRGQVTGLGTGTLLASCRTSYTQAAAAAGVRGGRPLGRGYVTEQAFRWVAWAPGAATVDIVSAGPGPQGATVRAVTRIGLWWAAGDWRVIAPPGGDWGNSAAPLTSLRGYLLFPAQP
jgi:hypothetical protein